MSTKACARAPVRVDPAGGGTDAPPFSSRNPEGKPEGLAVDLCREAAIRVAQALDLETLELDSFMFGSTVVQAEAGGRAFSTTVNTTNLDGSPLLVNITAELDEQSRTLTWLFDSIDPETGGPPNGIDDGFLPVNDESGIGEGKVTFRIGVLPDTPVGEVIMNDANIFFDTNAPIMTPTTTNVIFEDLMFISDYEETED